MIKSDCSRSLRRTCGAFCVLLTVQTASPELAQAFPGDTLLPKGLRFSRDKVKEQPDSAATSSRSGSGTDALNAQGRSPSAMPIETGRDVSPQAVKSLQPYFNDIPNLRYVSGRLLRGGQPSDQGLAFLKDIGVRTIINLRTEPVLIAREKIAAERLGLKYVELPTYTVQEPDAKQFQTFLTVATNPADGPVYVHCYHGRDRTGTMIGAYRIAENGWTFDAAFQEMMACGFRPGFAPLTNGLHRFAQARGDKSPLPTSSFIMSDLAKRFHK